MLGHTVCSSNLQCTQVSETGPVVTSESLVTLSIKGIYKACSEIIETTAKLLECMGLGYKNLQRIIISLL